MSVHGINATSITGWVPTVKPTPPYPVPVVPVPTPQQPGWIQPTPQQPGWVPPTPQQPGWNPHNRAYAKSGMLNLRLLENAKI